MIELYFIYNGHRRIHLGDFHHMPCAIQALKNHQASNSAINRPNFVKSMSGDAVRIDYGARDCYYMIEVKKESA